MAAGLNLIDYRETVDFSLVNRVYGGWVVIEWQGPYRSTFLKSG